MRAISTFGTCTRSGLSRPSQAAERTVRAASAPGRVVIRRLAMSSVREFRLVRMVGRNVRRLRVAAGLSQAQLAEKMGVDRAYVSGLELGQRNPTIVTLWHIAQALGVKLRPFFDEEKPGRPRR